MHIAADGEGTGYAFSIGLWHSHRHPELVVFGFPPENGQAWLNDLAERIAGGARFEAGTEVPEFSSRFSRSISRAS